MKSVLSNHVLYFVYLAIAEFCTVYISTVGFIYTGEQITDKIRTQYLAGCLRQNIGFYDRLGAGEVTTRITSDMNLIQDGISEKVGLTLAALATFSGAFVVSFVKFWKLTLILCSTIVAIFIVMVSGAAFRLKYSILSLETYAQGGSIAEEVISSIRTATAFGTQDKLASQYDKYLSKAEKYGFRTKIALGSMIAGFFLVIYLNYGLAFWQGAHFLVKKETDLGSILTIILAIMTGAFSLSNVSPHIQAFTTAKSAAAKVFDTIDRVSPIDPASNYGEILDLPDGKVEIELCNIKHIYPSRPDVTVMNDVSLVIPAGKQTALVGASGSGKSTVVGLVERFYEPVEGVVRFNGRDISRLNLRWLRQQVSLVGQEPTLFATSIFENIRHGLVGTPLERGSEQEQKEHIIEAAKTANAHDFIMSLPDGYDTNIGDRGFLLSGGQKQRIAIARAIVSDPKILLLDEATSALDTKSEGIVQAALEAAAAGRTTIAIAHRLSTIKNADNIVVMGEGRIIEQGTHDELLQKGGAYFKLVEAQQISQAKAAVQEEDTDSFFDDEKLWCQISFTDGPDFSENLWDGNTNFLQRKKSIAKRDAAEKGEATTTHYSLWSLMKVIASFNKPEWGWMFFGLCCSIVCGGGNPTQAVFFAKQVVSLAKFPVLESSGEVS